MVGFADWRPCATMSGIVGWSSGYQSAGPYRLAICARVNVALEPGKVCCTVVSSWAGAAGGAGGGIGFGGGPAKPKAHGIGTSAACAAVATPAAVANVKAVAAKNSLFIASPFLVLTFPGPVVSGCRCK